MLLALSRLYSQTESETSYTWKLDTGIGKIMTDDVLNAAEDKTQELMLDILMSTVTNSDGMWKKTSMVSYCSNCPNRSVLRQRNNRGLKDDSLDDSIEVKDEELDCGKPVNSTDYDHLVRNRMWLPHLEVWWVNPINLISTS